MAITIGQLLVKLGADTADLKSGMNEAKDKVESFRSSVSKAAEQTASLFTAMLGIEAAQAAFGGLKSAALDFNAMLEQSRVAWTNMLQSSAAADVVIDRIKKYSAVTPFQFQDLDKNIKMLTAMGFAVDDVLDASFKGLANDIANAASYAGGGVEKFQQIAVALGQMHTAGRLNAQDMMQLTDARLPAWDMLAKAMGKTVPEVRQLSEQGKIAGDTMVKAFEAWARMPEVANQTTSQSRTFLGVISTIKDNLLQIGSDAFRPIFDQVANLARAFADLTSKNEFAVFAARVSNVLTGVVNLIRQVPAPVQQAVIAFGAFAGVVALVAPLLPIIGMGLAVLTGPVGIVAAAVAALFVAWQTNFLGIRDVVAQVAPVIGGVISVLAGIGVTVAEFAANWQTHLANVKAAVSGVVTSVGSFLTGAFNSARDAAVELGAKIAGAAVGAFSALVSAVQPAIVPLVSFGVVVAAVELPGLIAGLARATVAFGVHAAQVAAATAAYIAHEAVGIARVATSIPSLIASLVKIGATYAIVAAQAIASAAAQAAAWIATVIPAVLAGAGAIIAAISPAILTIAAIGAAAAGLAIAWQNNWGDIQGITKKVLDWIGEQLAKFINWLKGLPIIGDAVDKLAGTFSTADNAVSKWSGDAQKGIGGVVDAVKTGDMSAIGKALGIDLGAGIGGGILEGLKGKGNSAIDDALKSIQDAFKTPEKSDAQYMREAQKSADDAAAALARNKAAADAGAAANANFGNQAAAAANKAKAQGISTAELVSALVAVNPATKAAADAVSYWQRQIDSVNLAIKANQDQLKAAQNELQGMQDHLASLNAELQTTQERFNELTKPRLTGIGDLEMQINAVGDALKRMDLADATGVDFSTIMAQYPLLTKGAQEYLATLPQTREGLQAAQKQLQALQSVRYDEQLRLIDQAANPEMAEMTYADAMSQMLATKQKVADLTSAVKEQEAAIKSQEGVIKSIQKAGEALNETLATYQQRLKDAEVNQKAVNDGLSMAYKWFVEDRQKMIDMGGAAAEQVPVIDAQMKLLLGGMDAFSQQAVTDVNTSVATMVGQVKSNVDVALGEIAKLDTTVVTTHIIRTIEEGSSAPAAPAASGTSAIHAATGADFVVGGSGGTDSQFVPMWLTPGERVQVTPPGQAADGPAIDYDRLGASVAAAMAAHPTVQVVNPTYQGGERTMRDDIRLISMLSK